mgnify:CR=1 FL=1
MSELHLILGPMFAGKTTSLMALVTGIMNFWSSNTFINLLTKSEGLKAETLSKLKSLFSRF